MTNDLIDLITFCTTQPLVSFALRETVTLFQPRLMIGVYMLFTHW